MNEQEWMQCGDPERLVTFLHESRGLFAIERKLRLFGAGCLRCVWAQFTDQRIRDAVEVAERYVDGKASDDELTSADFAASDASAAAYAAVEEMPDAEVTIEVMNHASTAYAATFIAGPDVLNGVLLVVRFLTGTVFGMSDRPDSIAKLGAQADLLRDIFGNPFRPVAIDVAWLTPKVKMLAQTIYDERRFADMPLLANALEEAGCIDADILEHCRQPGEHVCGCWVVDLLLGKA